MDNIKATNMSYFRENIEKLEGYVPGFQPADDEIKLNTNENPYPPSKAVMETLAAFNPERLRKYPQPMADTFRDAAAQLNGVRPENILATNGGDDALTITIRSFCDEKRPLAYATPTYTLYAELAQIQNCPVIEVPFMDDFGETTDKLVKSRAKLVIVCNPNAPTTEFRDPALLENLAKQLCGKAILLIDEAYSDFAPANCTELIKKYENVVILRSMSKGYSLAGLRFGYLIACEELILGMTKVKDSYNVDAVAIAAATAAIKDQNYFRQNVDKVKAERQRLTKVLKGMDFAVAQSSTNFLWVTCTANSARYIFEELKKRHIYVRYFPYEGISDKLRITIGTKQQNDLLAAELKDILSK